MGKQKLFRVQAMNEKGMMLDVEVMGAGAWLLQFMRAWQHACAAQDAESAVQA